MLRRITLKQTTAISLLSLFIVSELLLTTLLRNKLLSPSTNGIVLFLLSLSIGLFPFMFLSRGEGITNKPVKTNIAKYVWWFLVALNFFFWVRYTHLNPVRAQESDIIPTIEILVKRQQSGIFPYNIISDWGYSLQPTYMPLTWMPFHLAEFMLIDYRYIVFASWLLLCYFLFRKFLVTNNNTYGQLFLLIVLQAIFWLFLFYGDLTFVRTVELMIAVY